jgi:hypothetical protein
VVNMNILVPKVGSLEVGPKNKMVMFLEQGSKDFD